MSRTTSELRRLWRPACKGPWAQVTLNGGAKFGVRPAIVESVMALDAIFQKWGYRATPPDCGCYNCRTITGGDPSKSIDETGSLHAFAIALDINWNNNGYGPRLVTDMKFEMVADIEAIRTNSGAVVWRWGGRYKNNKDAMHYEIVASPAELLSGINWNTVHAGKKNEVKVKTTFQFGDSGISVKWIQAFLNIAHAYRVNAKGKVGGAKIPENGRFDAMTREAVREFQRFANRDLRKQGKVPSIVEDGIYGPVTAFLLATVVQTITKKK